ncbi:C6 finger domain-containing protein [Cordyceps javanica]|uniref:C6 finger domain-containing protein n=1 Tax=Cordyceps javanica TaxID=43265 RepID=A0A545VWS1_9HYPO|nr:C6 finger domain-containing protein [Cordyceps javanica]TQW06172.1 C6 finger domain-containing protein [Cordyceps javanica]
MLLYTRRALPKIPKKRSRAGCEFCRVKEAGQECVYGPVRPRQRRSTAQNEADQAGTDASAWTELPLTAAYDESFDAGGVAGDGAAAGSSSQLCRASSLPLRGSSSSSSRVAAAVRPSSLPSDIVAAKRSWSFTRQAGAFYATPHLELNMPLFSEFTTIKGRRGLLDHFSNKLSHLIVLREDEGNPFQQLVLPMSRQSPAVASAIYALSSAHLEFRGAAVGDGVEKKSIEFHSEAARNLVNLIDKGAKGNQNELLAAVMLLIYYEVLVHREQSDIVNGHLKGAMAILNSGPATSDPTRAFLERAFRFYDVIAALSFRRPTLSASPTLGSIDRFLPVDSRGTSQPVGSADALLGMATSLWPIVHQLSNLGALKSEVLEAETSGRVVKAEQLWAELSASASAIEASLLAWEPEPPPSPSPSSSPSPSPDHHHHSQTPSPAEAVVRGPLAGILNNAWAYRHSSLVYLRRSIYGLRREDPRVQEHARASLRFCVGTVQSEGPKGALLWPLFVAGCEVQTPADRALAAQAFAGIDEKQGMANIEQSWRIVQEVWRRADEADTARAVTAAAATVGEGEGGEAGSGDVAAVGMIGLQNTDSLDAGEMRGPDFAEEDLWRQVCRDMELSVVFG